MVNGGMRVKKAYWTKGILYNTKDRQNGGLKRCLQGVPKTRELEDDLGAS